MNFSLPDTEGNLHSPGGGPATVVVFTCNHCPYALAWHERIIDLARDYAGQGVKVLAINSNDAVKYPHDSPEASAKRVADGDFGDVPYLIDSSQEIAKAYDAQFTPDVYVLDDNLAVRYHGAPDADYEEPALEASYVRDAVDALLAGKDPQLAETQAVGCTIKWKG